MKNYYFAMMEFETEGITQAQGNRLVAAMNELKDAAAPIGNVTYYQVKHEAQYRKAEKEFKKQVNG